MSFRLRLLLAFAFLALLEALLFTLLSDQLLRDGMEGEADERLSMVASLFARELPKDLWPAPSKPGFEWRRRLGAELKDYAASYKLERASLLVEDAFALDSRGASLSPPEYWLGDGLRPPQVTGQARVSGPLFKSSEGWHKALYLKMDPGRALWLRVEVGTPFLGQVSALQRRLFKLAWVLMLPSMLLGAGLAWRLAVRARQLSTRLEGSPSQVRLEGSDEFAALSVKVEGLIKSLDRERQAREHLLSQRLSQARHLAFGVAHELRNPLAGLALQTDLLRRKAGEGARPAELDPIAARVLAETERLEGTVSRFLDFARTPELKPEMLELGSLALEAGKGFKPNPKVEGEARAFADRRSVLVVLGVLLSNACEAAGDGGSVTLRVNSLRGMATLEVGDSGPAIPESDREKLFSPFFTTKPKGMGLGLATAAVLAEAMGGRLWLKEDGKTFTLELAGNPEAQKKQGAS